MLKLSKITCYYGKVAALRELSLEIHAKETVCLIGANGAGKTTTLNAICGLLKPVSGEITFFGERIDHLHPHQILRFGICQVPEGRKIFPDMTVLENLKIGAYIYNDKRKVNRNISKIYDYFPLLEERKGQLAGTLSGGEQQMLAIGRALMSDPKLLLLDEPSLGLSPIMIQEIVRIIKDIQEIGVTIFLVEQKSFALRIVERGYVLENGSISFHEKSENLLTSVEVRKAYLGV